MLEGFITILGLCLTFLPVFMYFNYLLTHVSKKTSFDYHLEIVKDKKGDKGVVIAYLERILYGAAIVSFGILLSEYFANEVMFACVVITSILYVIVKWIDEKNEK
ncbi:MAG: hypothetical protein E7171_00165 [Firmicutes bacterium]|nr:hypothetical protein [Bacillota bacterium]